MPHLENCPHSHDSWCFDCVKELGEENMRLRDAVHDARTMLIELETYMPCSDMAALIDATLKKALTESEGEDE